MQNPRPLIDQPTNRPTRKVLAGGLTAGGTATVVWLARVLWGVEVPADVATFLVAGLGAVVAWFTRDHSQRPLRGA